MDEDFQRIEPEVESWYGAELRLLRSANEQVAFYSGDNHVCNEDIPQDEFSDVESDDSHHERGLLMPKQIHTSLDPFVALPGGVPEHQRMRVQFYTQTLGPGIFGVSNTPRYSPTAATGISTAVYSQVGRAWICILVDETLNILRGGTGQDRELSIQRARGFHDLNKALRSGDDHFQEALMALTICGLSEFRFGTSHSRNMHTTAVDMLIRSKGGLRATIEAAPNVEPFYIGGQFGFGRCHIPTVERLESTIECWKADILAILSSPRPILDGRLTSIPGMTAIRRDYRTRESRIVKLAIDSIDTIAPPTIFAAAMHLSLFTELAWTILQFGARFDLAISFFKRIEYLVKGSFDGGMLTNRAVELRAAAIATMVSRARRDILGSHAPNQLADSDVSITGIHINVLKMFLYLEPEGRHLIMTKFATWLQQKEFSSQQPLILDTELAALEAQITETWIRTKPG